MKAGGRREQIRLSALRYCEAAGWMGLRTDLVLQFLRMEGYRGLTVECVREELRYLEEKQLVERKPKLISPEIEVWQATAAGRDFLAQNNPGEVWPRTR